MTIADEARANAIHCEMVLYAYRKNKDGMVVSFVVHPNDIPKALSVAPIGSRYITALVQIGDDEKPITQAEKENDRTPVRTAAQPQPSLKSAGAPRNWRDVSPAQQSGIRCVEPTFAAFLREQRPDDWHETRETTECVRLICGVKSRSELETNQRARVIWHSLDTEYQGWLAKERVGL